MSAHKASPLHYWIAPIYSIGIGFFAFISFLGMRPLLPSNIAWLENGDPATFYLGWQFFRNSPWSLPIGLNPEYGLELSNSILFSDSNPLFAFLFKPFTGMLPEVFQYFGIWLLLCFVLQAWFAFKLLGLITKNSFIAMLGATFFVFSPPLMWRLSGHFSLASHFLILAGLYLVLRPQSSFRIPSWLFLVGVAALVHPYLLAMTGILWGADFLGRYIKGEFSATFAALEFFLVGLLTTILCWQVGYFTVGAGVAAEGFGHYRMNLLSMLDADGFSYVLQRIPKAAGDVEGFNYLGLGLILLSLCIGLQALTNPSFEFRQTLGRYLKKWPVLFIAMLCLTVFALSNRIGIAHFQLHLDIPIPNAVNVFRASGRMFWPVYYLIMFAILFFVVRAFNTRVVVILLGLCLLVQYLDTSKMWLSMAEKYRTGPSAVWQTPLSSPFWDAAAGHYKKIKVLLPRNQVRNWQTIAYYASTHQLPTNAVYLGRVSSLSEINAQSAAAKMLLSGQYEADTLYFIDETTITFDRLSPEQLPIVLNKDTDLLARIDGFAVLAPGWKDCVNCPQVKSEIAARELLPPALDQNKRVLFGHNLLSKRYLGEGWADPDHEGVWSTNAKANLVFPLSKGNVSKLVFEARPLTSSAHLAQKIQVQVNGIPAMPVTLLSDSGNRFEIDIPKKIQEQLLRQPTLIKVEFEFPNAARPFDLGINNDLRQLAIQLWAVTLVSN